MCDGLFGVEVVCLLPAFDANSQIFTFKSYLGGESYVVYF